MPGIEFVTSGDVDGAPTPPVGAPQRRTATVVLAAVALVAALLVGVLIGRVRQPSHPAAAASSSTAGLPSPGLSSSASSSHSATPGPTVADADNSDVLDYTGVFTTSGSLGSRTVSYAFGLVNITAQALRIEYPIELIGHDGAQIPAVFAGIYDDTVALSRINSFALPSHRLAVIPPGAGATLLMSIHIDCNNPAVTDDRPGEQPVVRIRLAGSAAASGFSLPRLASGFQDAVTQICG